MKAHIHFRKGRRAQGGAAAVFAAIAVLAAITATMLAIEVGRVYSAQAALQKQANLAALDAARVVGGCSVEDAPAAETDPLALQLEVQTLVDQIIDSAGLTGTVSRRLDAGGTAEGVEVGVLETFVDPLTGTTKRQLVVGSDTPEAVRISLERPFPVPFLPLFPTQTGSIMTASATAEQTVAGSFYVGSGLLALDGGIVNALLSGLLGGNVSLTVADYNGLAGVNVSLGDLATAIGLDVQDLSDPLALQAQNPLLGDLLNGLSGALAGTTNSAVTGLLQGLADAAEAGSNNPVPLGDLFPTVNDAGANVPMINLLDLLIAAGAAANADPSGAATPIALPVVLSIPGVATLNTFLQVLEPPQFSGMGRPGEAEAHTAQIRLMVRLQVDALDTISDALTLVLGAGLLGSVDVQPLNLGIDLQVAKASAYLDRIDCPRSSNPELAAELSARAAVADLKIGTFDGDPLDAPAISDGAAQLLGVSIDILGGLLASIDVNLFLDNPVAATVGSAAKTPLPEPVTEFEWNNENEETPYWQALGVPPEASASANPQTVGSSGLLGGTLSSLFSSLAISASDPAHPNANSNICLLLFLCVPVGDILDAVLDPVVALLGTILAPTGALVDSLLDPLLQLLGVQLGTATVVMNTVALDTVHLVSMEVLSPP